MAQTDPLRGAPMAPSRVSIPEIVQDLAIGRHSVYQMLESGILPGIRLKRGWLVTRHAYESWKRTCGARVAAGPAPNAPQVNQANRQAA
jgi:hypothetical protein